MERESMEFDVVIVGAGPAGLSTAIRLAQIAQEKEQETTICVVEKGSEVGAHIMSGAVFEPTALNNLPENIVVGTTYTIEIVGDLTIMNRTNSVTFNADVTVTSADSLSGTATATVA